MLEAERKILVKEAKRMQRYLDTPKVPLPPAALTITPMHTIIPCGRKGRVFIDHSVVDEKAAFVMNLVHAVNHDPAFLSIEPGVTTRLFVNGEIMMSDVVFERRTNAEIIHRAHGDVLIAGLGIGMIILPICNKVGVRRVTVIEKYQEVIDLVEPHLRKTLGANGEKLRIEKGDIVKTKIPKNFPLWDVIYFDIWPTVSDWNLPEIRVLKKRYKPFLKRTGTEWIGAWMESVIEKRFKNGLRRVRRQQGGA